MEEKFNEVWRVIEDNPDYEVSNLGRVRNKITQVLKEIYVYEKEDGYKKNPDYFSNPD